MIITEYWTRFLDVNFLCITSGERRWVPAFPHSGSLLCSDQRVTPRRTSHKESWVCGCPGTSPREQITSTSEGDGTTSRATPGHAQSVSAYLATHQHLKTTRLLQPNSPPRSLQQAARSRGLPQLSRSHSPVFTWLHQELSSPEGKGLAIDV